MDIIIIYVNSILGNLLVKFKFEDLIYYDLKCALVIQVNCYFFLFEVKCNFYGWICIVSSVIKWQSFNGPVSIPCGTGSKCLGPNPRPTDNEWSAHDNRLTKQVLHYHSFTLWYFIWMICYSDSSFKSFWKSTRKPSKMYERSWVMNEFNQTINRNAIS